MRPSTSLASSDFFTIINLITAIGIDLGITNTKVAFQVKSRTSTTSSTIELFYHQEPTEDFIIKWAAFMKKNDGVDFKNFTETVKIALTGVGSIKYKSMFEEIQNLRLTDELTALVKGLQIEDSSSNNFANFSNAFIVNAGTGASFVTAKDFNLKSPIIQRVGGSSLCGGSFEGLSSLALKADSSQSLEILSSKQFWKQIYKILEKQAEIEKSTLAKNRNPNNMTSFSKDSSNLHKTIGQVLGSDKKIYGMQPDIIAAFFANLNFKSVNSFSSSQIIYELQRSIVYNLVKNAVENMNSVNWKNNLVMNCSSNSGSTTKVIKTDPIALIFTGRFFSLPNGKRFIEEILTIGKDLGIVTTEFEQKYVFGSNGMVGAKGCLMMAISM